MIYVSKEADKRLLEYLRLKDSVVLHGPAENLEKPVSCHADLLYVRLGSGSHAPVFKGDAAKLSPKYPGDCIYCGAVCGKYFIHNTKITDSTLLGVVKSAINDVQLVNVSQGYTRCSLAVIDSGHVITSDRGIEKALKNTKISCLLISPGQILLSGYGCGFIGGCMGRVENEIIFSGDLSAHSDFEGISDFIKGCGLSLKYFRDYPLTDIGSIIAG